MSSQGNILPSIFVSIASYRDKRCSATLQDVYAHAKHPQRIFVGICQQNMDPEDDMDCVDDVVNNPKVAPYKNNIRIIRMRSQDAKGPTYARYLCSTLYNNEDYFCQLDSHLRMHHDWDTLCINMINQIKTLKFSSKPLLSYYPKSYEDHPSNGDYSQVDKTVTRMCAGNFQKDKGVFSINGAEARPVTETPTLQPFIAGGFFFVEGRFLKEVPFDPSLDFIFIGEEISHSARAYTHGWDVYNPNINITFHLYTRATESKIWTDKTYSDVEALKRIRRYLHLEEPYLDDYPYGLGKARTIEQFYNYAGLDPVTKEITKNFCNVNLTVPEIPGETTPQPVGSKLIQSSGATSRFAVTTTLSLGEKIDNVRNFWFRVMFILLVIGVVIWMIQWVKNGKKPELSTVFAPRNPFQT